MTLRQDWTYRFESVSSGIWIGHWGYSLKERKFFIHERSITSRDVPESYNIFTFKQVSSWTFEMGSSKLVMKRRFK